MNKIRINAISDADKKLIALLAKSTPGHGVDPMQFEDIADTLSSGGAYIMYRLEPFVGSDLLTSLGYNKTDSALPSLETAERLFLSVTIFDISALFRKRYFANINVTIDSGQIFAGSISGRSIDDIFIFFTDVIAGRKQAYRSTQDAISAL